MGRPWACSPRKGKLDVDGFATWNTKQLPQWTSNNRDKDREPIAGLTQDNAGLNIWHKSPLDKIPLVLRLICEQVANSTVLFPLSTALPSCQVAFDAAQDVLCLPWRPGIYFRGKDGAQGDSPHWRVGELQFPQTFRAPPRGLDNGSNTC